MTGSSPTPLKLEDVIDPKYMTSQQVCAKLGIKMKTLHNQQSDGSSRVRPHGQLRFGRTNFNIWLTLDITSEWLRRQSRKVK